MDAFKISGAGIVGGMISESAGIVGQEKDGMNARSSSSEVLGWVGGGRTILLKIEHEK
ncbi:hypothetical protein FHR81_001056 [Actinoalloteichus hoggarensis]|uniref:hypothetical protein n=1 Tax=Actinoalloteichus hoggarensis TaxID=1470176 RepID=UPI0012FE6BD3|nr:hypothetical protein [Actinoalloteichus hoggarensis]MBB5920026.1 hypothetical protein [Actinoalloteichus hoggarensis]